MRAALDTGSIGGTQTRQVTLQQPVIEEYMGHRYDMLNTYFYLDPTSLSPV